MKKLFVVGLFVAASVQAQTATVVELSSSPDQKIAALEQSLIQKGRALVQMQQHIDMLQQELNQLRGATETQDYRLNQILQRQRELYQELDKLSTRISTSVSPTVSEQGSDQSGNAGIALSESDAYKRALSLVTKAKQYDKAIVEFNRFLTTFPQSSYVANVHYWLGQLYLTKGNKAQSKQHFTVLVDDFKKSNKRADAWVKLARIEADSNQTDIAKSIYTKVIKEYPQSGAAQIARTRLKALK